MCYLRRALIINTIVMLKVMAALQNAAFRRGGVLHTPYMPYPHPQRLKNGRKLQASTCCMVPYGKLLQTASWLQVVLACMSNVQIH